MTYIKLDQVEIDIPIYNSSHRLLKNKLLQTATAGRLFDKEDQHLVVKALQNINFAISEGERVGLIGHNGAGKSTLLRVLNGIYHPTAGEIDCKGETASLIDVSIGIDPEATGRENIFLRGALLGLKKSKIASLVEGIIKFSELGHFIDVPVRSYSSGMHLRLAFSVSTVIRPDILLMDEWLSVGDENFKAKAESRLSELVNDTKILVIASHSRELILKHCTRVLWLENGKIKMDGNPSDVCKLYFVN